MGNSATIKNNDRVNLVMTTLYQNKRIRIRPYKEDDVRGMYQCIRSSIPEMKAYLPWVHDKFSKEEVVNWILWAQHNWQQGCQYDFVIETFEANKTSQFIGGVGLLKVDLKGKSAELGFWLKTEYTGKGLTTEAAKLAVEFARNELELDIIYIYVDRKNKPSRKVAHKLGAKPEKLIKNHEDTPGIFIDSKVYSIKLNPLSL
jgi:ribosomal-protein-serine acetyltransferase